MRADLFEELAPVCPVCLHGPEAIEAPLVLADVHERRGGLIWHAILHCSNQACWMEFPVIDGIPVLVPDPRGVLAGARAHVLARDDLPEALESLIGDACGPGSDFDTTRQHLSLYAGTHFTDWTEAGGVAEVPGMVAAGFETLGAPAEGPAIDLGCSVGRGVWELAARVPGSVVGGDLNLSMLRLAQTLMLEGRAHFPRRRIGVVYDRTGVELPAGAASDRIDFWAMDSTALPFPAGRFGLAFGLNHVDCISNPTAMIAEAARVLAPGAGAVFTTPYDWSPNATEPVGWMGGHSQRGPTGGAGEPVLTATLAAQGLTPVAERDDLTWSLTMHARAVMQYRLHLVACRRGG